MQIIRYVKIRLNNLSLYMVAPNCREQPHSLIIINDKTNEIRPPVHKCYIYIDISQRTAFSVE